MSRRVPISFEPEPAALNRAEALRFLGIGKTTLWRLENLPDSNPRRIRKTAYGTYPVTELERHLAAETRARRAA